MLHRARGDQHGAAEFKLAEIWLHDVFMRTLCNRVKAHVFRLMTDELSVRRAPQFQILNDMMVMLCW